MRETYRPRAAILALLAALLVAASALPAGTAGAAQATPADRPAPPEQPRDGPGGQERAYPSSFGMRLGEDPDGAWLYVPAGEDGQPILGESFPVVLFFHGYGGTRPLSFLSWVRHLAEGGAIVIYPNYQYAGFFGNDSTTFYDNALAGIELALDELERDDLPDPDLDRVAVVGHSAGGVLAANYAANAERAGLPVPDVLFAAMPGGCLGCDFFAEQLGLPLDIDAGFDPDTLALVLVGADDEVAGDGAARLIWEAMSDIPSDRRDYVTLFSDIRGDPGLVADHLQPQTNGALVGTDALDWYGTWKWLDALTACAFAGDLCDHALGDTTEQRYMGEWSNGVPVREPEITDEP